jgi:DNA-binding transcriptional regulator YhcF (GntR family)
MAFDPDDKRPLFERVVDDLRNDIKYGRLKTEERVPPARELAERYGIANMTAQRALRELQNQGLIYGVPGKGSFVRPDARDKLFPEPVEIRNEDEYKAVRDTFVAAMDASNAALEAAIASEDIQAIKAAKAQGDQVLTEQYANMLGMNYYSHRKTNPNFDAQTAAHRTEAAAEAAARKAERDQPERTPTAARKRGEPGDPATS